jgi:toxin ParE1/3/4
MNLEKTNDDPKLRFSPFALTDIKGTWQYVSEQNEDSAKKIIREISEKCKMLSINPKIGRERNDLIIGLRLFPHKRYNIYYFITEFGVEIYRVLHSSRDNIQVFDTEIDKLN